MIIRKDLIHRGASRDNKIKNLNHISNVKCWTGIV